jgi:hypothetical protein
MAVYLGMDSHAHSWGTSAPKAILAVAWVLFFALAKVTLGAETATTTEPEAPAATSSDVAADDSEDGDDAGDDGWWGDWQARRDEVERRDEERRREREEREREEDEESEAERQAREEEEARRRQAALEERAREAAERAGRESIFDRIREEMEERAEGDEEEDNEEEEGEVVAAPVDAGPRSPSGFSSAIGLRATAAAVGALNTFFPSDAYAGNGLGALATWSFSSFGLLAAATGTALVTGKASLAGSALVGSVSAPTFLRRWVG